MPQITANGIPFEYDIHGPETGEPILLIMGLGAQMTAWPMDFVNDLTARGYRVARYDNRDVGLSHKFEEHGAPDMTEVFKACSPIWRPMQQVWWMPWAGTRRTLSVPPWAA